MSNQRICSYSGETASGIASKIANDAERYRMPVKTVSLTSHVNGYSISYAAIAVFEAEDGNGKHED